MSDLVQGFGFPLNDHKRVSHATVWVEQHQFDSAPQVRPPLPARGLVRVMLLQAAVNGGAEMPMQTQGDWGLDYANVVSVITEYSPGTGVFVQDQPVPAGINYFVRCVVSPPSSGAPRTWQLRVAPPGENMGAGVLTAPIHEFASADEVAAAINATGCPPCTVWGYGKYALSPTGEQFAWPARVWHVNWSPDAAAKGWFMTSRRLTDLGGGVSGLVYVVGASEVPIQLIPTCYRPTPWGEHVFLPFQMSTSPPLAGSIGICQTLPGLGLQLISPECWQYAD